MIRVRDLEKTYDTRFGKKTVFEQVNFDLSMGQRLGILGRNGAGKSTLIRLVSGAEKPTSGTIERSMSVSWPLAFGGAFQPQLTGVDNIRFITSVYDQDFSRNLAFVEDFAELGPYLREPVRTYSSGMRARLAFAISMIIEFDCFLIDEIGAVGDARFHDRCNHELFDVRGNRAMIIISHDAGYLREHCNRWAILHQGKLDPFDDFEVAYARYKELIGAEMRSVPVSVDLTNRAKMIASSQRAALTDERFRVHVQQGDWARDQRDWAKAERDYEAALGLYPYQRSYWTQLGHVTKEQGRFAAAEIAYRTAAALGEPKADVEDHARFVMAQQGDAQTAAELHAPNSGDVYRQPPARPDLDIANLLFGGESDQSEDALVEWFRTVDTLDSLVSRLATKADQSNSLTVGHATSDEAVIDQAFCLFGGSIPLVRRKELRSQMRPGDNILQVLFEAGAFAGWPLSEASVARCLQAEGQPSALMLTTSGRG